MQRHSTGSGRLRIPGSRALVAISLLLAAAIIWGVSGSLRRDARRPVEPSAKPSRLNSVGEKPTPAESAAARQQLQEIVDDVPNWVAAPGYVGSSACRQCHPKEFESYLQTSHSQSLARVNPETEPRNDVFDHRLSGRRYRITRRDGQLIHEESLVLSDESEVPLTSTPLKYRVGSGKFARTYLCDFGGGFLFESPVTWYEATQSWSMTPGYDRLGHRSFSRPVLENCLWCHSGQTSVGATSHFRLRPVEEAIGCERCHGPGQGHVAFRNEKASAQDASDPIINPKRLSRSLSEAICQQCHLQGEIHVGGRNVRDADFRPGLALEEFGTVYRLRKSGTEMTVVGHAEQLNESPCYKLSGTMTCITCHDPHQSVPADRRVQHNRETCTQCHADRGCKVGLSLRETQAKNDCVLCHMPKSATEVPHVAFTHHRIGIHPLKTSLATVEEDLLVPLSDLSRLSEADRERSLMLAKLQMYLKRGPKFQNSDAGSSLAGEIESWMQSLPQDIDVETEFARTQFLFSRGDVVGAKLAANRALASPRIRSEEAAALLDQLGQLDFQQGHLAAASQRFRELVNLRCQGADWFRLGVTEERRGDLLNASFALERAMQLDPANTEIYQILSRVSRSTGETGKAEGFREKGWRLQRAINPQLR